MEVRTEPLPDPVIEGQLPILYALCLEFDPGEIDVSYGWACNLDVDQLWKDQRIPTSSLRSFVDRSTSEGIMLLGDSDLHIKGVRIAFSFTICHESDVHFESPDPLLVSRVTSAWAASGLRFYPVERGRRLSSGCSGQPRSGPG